MNSIETTWQIEKKFEKDRVEKLQVPSSPRAVNALRTTKSAPLKGLPRASLLIRSPTSLLDSNIDNGLMDIWVDDGTNGNIDSTVRMLRFSTAASAIDGLLYSPRRKKQGVIATKQEEPRSAPVTLACNPFLSSEKAEQDSSADQSKRNVNKPSHSHCSSHDSPHRLRVPMIRSIPGNAVASSKDVTAARKKGESLLKNPIDTLVTEPITPPRPDDKGSSERLVGTRQTHEKPRGSASKNALEQALHRSAANVKTNETGVAFFRKRTSEDMAEPAPQIKRKLSAFFSKTDETPGVRLSPQSSTHPQEAQDTKRESKLSLESIFKRRSKRVLDTPPSPAVDSVSPKDDLEQPDKRGTDGVSQVFKMKPNGLNTEAETPPQITARKKFIERCQADAVLVVEQSEKTGDNCPDGQEYRRGIQKPKLFNLLKRRSNIESQMFSEDKHNSRQNEGSSNEHGDLSRKKEPGKLVKLVKKLSSGLRDRRGVENNGGDWTPGKQPRSAAPEQPTKSALEEQDEAPKADREMLQRLLNKLSFKSKDEMSDSDAGQEEAGTKTPRKGAFFVKLFKRRSTNNVEKESETGTRPHCQQNDSSHPSSSSSPLPESETWWTLLSGKMTRFLSMLVH